MSKYLLLSPIGPNDTFFGDFESDKEAFVYFVSKMIDEYMAKTFSQFGLPHNDPTEISFHLIKNDGSKLELPGIPGAIATFTVHKLANISP